MDIHLYAKNKQWVYTIYGVPADTPKKYPLLCHKNLFYLRTKANRYEWVPFQTVAQLERVRDEGQ